MVYSWDGKRVFRTCLIETCVVDAHPKLPIGLRDNHRIGQPPRMVDLPYVTGREMQLRGITATRPTPENGRDNFRFPIGICSFLKVVKLLRLRATPPSIRTWYSLTLVMVGETSSGSCQAPALLLGQSEASNPIGVSTHLRCGVAFGARATAAISRCKVLMTHLYVMAQEPLNMTWSFLRRSLSLGLRVGVAIDSLQCPLGILELHLCIFLQNCSTSFLISQHSGVLWHVELCTGHFVLPSLLLDG
jgi:hypothetical protein